MAYDFILDSASLSEREIINSIINSRFIIDYGTVTANNGDGTIDVQHAVPITLKYPPSGYSPNSNPSTTHNVEVLFLSGAQFSSKFTLAVGDPVLLVGLKDFVPNTQAVTGVVNTVFPHYNQNTLKAIPLAGPNTNALAQINVLNGLLQIKNASQSLFTILNNLLSALNTFATTPTASWANYTASQGVLATSLTTIISNLAALLTA